MKIIKKNFGIINNLITFGIVQQLTTYQYEYERTFKVRKRI